MISDNKNQNDIINSELVSTYRSSPGADIGGVFANIEL